MISQGFWNIYIKELFHNLAKYSVHCKKASAAMQRDNFIAQVLLHKQHFVQTTE